MLEILPTAGHEESQHLYDISDKKCINSNLMDLDTKNTELHLACLQNTEEILDILINFPDQAFAQNKSQELPLHYACLNKNITVDDFRLILSCNPDATYAFTKDRCLPLHYYCAIGAPNIEIVHLLLDANPETVYEQTECLMLFDSVSESHIYSNLLRQRCQNSACIQSSAILSLSMVQLESEPASFWNSSVWKTREQPKVVEDYETGWSPLHIAVMNSAPINSIVELILAKDLRTSLGRKALDCAMTMLINAKDVEVCSLKAVDKTNAEKTVNLLRMK